MAIEEIVLKDGKKRFKVRVRDLKGKWYQVKSFDLKRDADRYERDLCQMRDRHEFAIAKQIREQKFSDYLATWMATMRPRVSDGWRISQDQMLRDYILPSIGEIKLLALRTEDLGRIFENLCQLKRSAQMQLHVYNLLNRILTDATHAHQIISRNPLSSRFRPDIKPVERNHLNTRDSKRLLAASRDHRIGLAIWLGLLAALRPSEVQGLRWASVDFQKNLITVKDAYKRKVGKLESLPKGKHVGMVPMIPALRDLLLKHSQGRLPDDFVVQGFRKPMLGYSAFRNVLNRLCQELGIKVVTPHELRHSAAELWVEQGATEEDIVRLLNHSGAASVRRYIHRDNSRLQHIASAIAIPSIPIQSDPPRAQLRLVQ